MRVSMSWVRAVAVGLVVLTALTSLGPFASAAEPTGAQPSKSLAASVARTVATLKQTTPRATQSAGATSSSGGSESFFKTPTGIATAVLMVAGAAYVGISIGRDNKKVHSPIR